MTKDLLSDLAARRAKVLAGGGEKRIARQHKMGKHTARERIHRLLDENSFVELYMHVNHRCNEFGMTDVDTPGEGVVTGYGTVGGRLVYIFAQDFTVMGGSLGEMHAKKITDVMAVSYTHLDVYKRQRCSWLWNARLGF